MAGVRPVSAAVSALPRAAVGGRVVLPILCLAIVLGIGASPNSIFEITSNWLFDAYQRLSPARRAEPEVVVIDIDAESIRRIGQWPWPRDQLGKLIDAARGARVVGMDLLLTEPDRLSPELWADARGDIGPDTKRALMALPSTDAALAASVARVPVVMSMLAVRTPEERPGVTIQATPIIETGVDPRRALPRFAALIRPLPVLAAAARGLGIVSVPPETDGVMRRIPTIVAVGESLVPGFAIEVLRVALAADHLAIRGDGAGLNVLGIGSKTIRIDGKGQVWPRYADPVPARFVPAYGVLQGAVDPVLFRDRIVLIGASAPGLGDIVVTPLRQSQTGATIQAQLIESILAGDELRRPPLVKAAELLAALALGVAATLLLGHLPDGVYALLFSVLAALLVVGSWLAFSLAGVLVDWIFPLVALAVAALIAFAARIGAEVRARRQREAELAEALFRAQAADIAKTEFLANVSHELRTPLSAVIGFSDVMARQIMGPLLPVYAEYARDINRSGTHLLAIIEDVLSLSVLDLGGAQAGDDRIDVASILVECEHMASTRAAVRSVTLAHEVAAGLPNLRADSRMVKQMIVNLLSNAIKYSPANREVMVRAVVDHGWLRISVRDSGRGIAAADLAYVMQRFGRLQSSRLAQEPGVGIGLPLTKSMIELHGGRIEISSEVGGGTEAVLWFPPTRLFTGEDLSA